MPLSALPAVAQEEPVTVSKESGIEYRTGLKLYNESKYTESISHFRMAYKLDDSNVAALFAHSLALNKLKKFMEAANMLIKVLDQEPGHLKAFRLLPSVLFRAGDHEKALTAYDSAIAAKPGDYYNYLGKARVLIKLKKYDEAVSMLKKSIERDSDQPAVYETLAFAYREQKNLRGALSAYDKALELKPGDTKYIYYRAQTLFELGRIEEAYRAASQILAQNKSHARARIIVADYKRLKGQYNEALDDYYLAAQNIETKAYAEYFIGVIKQKLEEIEIEKEWEASQKREREKVRKREREKVRKRNKG